MGRGKRHKPKIPPKNPYKGCRGRIDDLPGWAECKEASKTCNWSKLDPELVDRYYDKDRINRLIDEIVLDPTMRHYTKEMDPEFLARLDVYTRKRYARNNANLCLDDQVPETIHQSELREAREELDLAIARAKRKIIKRLMRGKPMEFSDSDNEPTDPFPNANDSGDDDGYGPDPSGGAGAAQTVRA